MMKIFSLIILPQRKIIQHASVQFLPLEEGKDDI